MLAAATVAASFNHILVLLASGTMLIHNLFTATTVNVWWVSNSITLICKYRHCQYCSTIDKKDWIEYIALSVRGGDLERLCKRCLMTDTNDTESTLGVETNSVETDRPVSRAIRRRGNSRPEVEVVSSDSKLLGKPWRIVVQLDRSALKFIDVKGSIAHKYYTPNYDVFWLQDNTVIQNTFQDVLTLKNKKTNSVTSISFQRFLYEQEDLGSDVQYVASDVSRLAKDIEQDFLKLEYYSRWGIRIWYKLPNIDVVSFIFDRVLKLTSETRSKAERLYQPDSINSWFAHF